MPTNRLSTWVPLAARQALAAGFVLVLSLGASASASPHPERGRPWIDSWSADAYAANSHQNWDVELDPSGLVWVSNSGGVQYYDGARWRFVPTPKGTIVYAMLPAEDGRVYLGTTSDIGYLEAGANATWRYRTLLEGHHFAGQADVPQFGEIIGVERTDGDIFYVSNRLLFRYRPATGRLSWIESPSSFVDSAVSGGELYLADRDAGVLRYDTVADRLLAVLEWQSAGMAAPGRLASDPEGRLRIVVENGVFVLEDGELRRLPTEVEGWLAAQGLYRAESLADGSLAIGSRRDGLVILDADGGLRRHVSRRSGLAWPWVCGLLLDRQGGLWAAQEGGISRIEADAGLTLFDLDLGVDGVQAFARYNGRLIAATLQGLKVLVPSREPLGQARFVPLAAENLNTWSLLDTGDQLLYGDRHGISSLRFDQDATAITERVYEGRRAVNMSLSPLDPDTVYAATGVGVVRLRRVDGQWHDEGKLRGVDVPIIYAVQADDGTLWFGTTTGTYSRARALDAWPDAAVERFDAAAGVPQGNAHLYRAGGKVLFGSWDGFFRFTGARFVPDPDFPSVLTDTTRDIHRLAEAPDGRLWIFAGGITGVANRQPGGRWDWDESPLKRLSGENVSAIHVDADGVVWLGRRSGVVRFDPLRWQPPAALPPARVHRVTIAGEETPLFGGATPAESYAGSDLEPAQDALRFEYAVADYAPPHKVQYRSMLDGVDPDWTEWSAETQRDFTSLPPGRRTLRVEARNSLGQVAPEGTYHVRLLPPWYRTWPAYLAWAAVAVLFLVGSAGWASRRRTTRLEAERQRLASLVDERTAEIRRQAEALTAEHEAKNRFFANVSHELRTPLTLTLGPLEDVVAGRSGTLPPDLSASIDTAMRNAQQLRNLVDQVLDIGRLEAGHMPLAASAGDLGNLLRRVATRFAFAAERAEITLELDGIEKGVEVFFDPAHLDRVVSNLLANALKFTPAGGRVAVRLTQRDGSAEIAIGDSGVGIAAGDLPRVFDRYFQAGRTVADQPGTGIGLALVRELVELHGGRVEAESLAGRGSTFRVSLRLGRDHLPDELVAQQPPADEPAPVAAEGRHARVSETVPDIADEARDAADTTTLLIVDDNAELRGFLRQRFAGHFRVVEAADGVEALEACRRSIPDLIISDVMMPNMDGLDLTRCLKSDPELDFIPVILLTARASTDDAIEGLGVGADDYLRKPFDGAELEARVERMIASRRRLRARFAAPEPAAGLEGSDADFDRRLLAAIEQQLESGDLSVQCLADRLAMDRTNLYRRVQATRGMSPQTLILKIRLQAAARLLAGGKDSVSEVAYGVGFNSLSHFSESFRRHFGLAPSKWRRQALATQT